VVIPANIHLYAYLNLQLKYISIFKPSQLPFEACCSTVRHLWSRQWVSQLEVSAACHPF